MSFFNDHKKIFTASAPGRLDVMGGIADYSGSLLLQMPIAKTLSVHLQERNDSLICIQTTISAKNEREFQIDYDLLKNKKPSEVGKIIHTKEGGDWAAYIIGCLSILESEKNISVGGMNIEVSSKIPIGKGVASSAAVEVAMMNAVCKMYDLKLSEIELPVLAQRVENIVAGAACGLMDQLSVHLGKKNKLLPIICQPHEVFAPITIPKGIQFCGIDSGVKHSVGGASYSDVRTSAFMAYTVIATIEGVSADELLYAKKKNDLSKLPYGGYLANIPVSVFEKQYSPQLPENISGKEFIEKYKISIDPVTEVNPEKNYKLLSCARHPVQENHRVNLFKQLLQQFSKAVDKKKSLQLLGELMLQSHASYSSVGLGNEATDEIVELAKQAGQANGIYGARVTGGGSGGTVAILCYGKEGKQTVKEIFQKYRKKINKKIYLFSGSENGSMILNQQNNIKQHGYYSAV